jgi:Transcriptional regulators
MTVSRALRNHPEVSPVTAERLRKIARSLGYTPNPLVSVLMENVRRGGRDTASVNLAFLHSGPARGYWKTLPHYRELFSGAKTRAAELGFGLETVWLDDPSVPPATLLRLLHARGVHGLVIGPVFRPEITLDLSSFAVVATGLSLKSPAVHRVATNQQAAIQIAVEHLQKTGRRRTGFILGQNTDRRYDHQWLGAAWAEYHARPPHQRVPPLLLSGDRHFARIGLWLRRHHPDSLLITDDIIAEIVREHIPDKTPAMVNLLWEEGRSTVPGLARDRVRIGASAINMLATMLARNERGVPSSAELLLVAPRWVEPLAST